MTVYNWKRKGLHPRLLAWKWALKMLTADGIFQNLYGTHGEVRLKEATDYQ